MKFKPCIAKDSIITVQRFLTDFSGEFRTSDVYYFIEQSAFELLVDWRNSDTPDDDPMEMAELYGGNQAFDAVLNGYGRVIFMTESAILDNGFPIEEHYPEWSCDDCSP